jgi:hypothetical protein
MKISKIISILFIVASFIFMADNAFAGLGISPSQMILLNLSKGAQLERTFVLSRSDPKENLYFTVTAEGATKDWTILNEGTKFTMPAGEKRFPITVAINIPKDVANGEYKGGIRLVSSPNPNGVGGNGASTALAVLIQTDFTITGEQVLKYDISSVGINNFEEGSPLDMLITIINSGNVNARPTKVNVEIYDKFNKELLESHDIIEMGSVAPFTTGDIIISIPVKLERDQYWARVSAYKNENLLKEEKLTFEIVEVGSLQKKGELKEILYNKKADIGETVKITGVFENTGKANYSAKLVAEIYKNDKMVKMIESDLSNVIKGQVENLPVYFTPETLGVYTVKAHVAYTGGKTGEKEAKISVGNVGLLADGGLLRSVLFIIAGLLILSVVLIGIFMYLRKNKTIKKRD